MLKRDIDTFLDDFFANGRQALLLTGARQIGKTFAIRELGKRRFDYFAEINFVETPEAAAIFQGAQSVQDVIVRLSAFISAPLVEGRTLVFFDEVQCCPECVTYIKFLVDDGRFRYALSGSLLGVEMKDLRSVPVGYMEIKEMFPLDFGEFAANVGVADVVWLNIHEAFERRVPVDDVVHERMMALFRLYLVVGGMPAVVNEYVTSHNIQQVVRLQESIVHTYLRDISQYDPGRKVYIKEVFNALPSELDAKNKRFIFKKIDKNIRFDRAENSFLWLKDAGVALPVYNVTEPKYPLRLSEQRNLFKLFSNDVGLLCCQYASGVQMRLLTGDDCVNYGAIYENVVAQELIAHGYSLYYYNSKKFGELDFLIEQRGCPLPLEVKSGKDYAKHNALDNVMSSDEFRIPEAYVLCDSNLCVKGSVTYMPIYMVAFIKRKEVDTNFVYHPNLDGLAE